MNEQEKFDELLLRTMSSTPPPQLSSHFNQRLTSQLHRERLNVKDRFLIWSYVIVAILVSIWLMHRESIHWGIIAASVGSSLIIVGVIRRVLRGK